jgi:hypothetical protein
MLLGNVKLQCEGSLVTGDIDDVYVSSVTKDIHVCEMAGPG